MERHQTTLARYPKPRAFLWFVLVGSLALVGCGVLALPERPDVGVPCVVFFGVCGAMALATILRQRRYARLSLLTVEIVGGTPIRPSRAHLAMVAATCLALGLVLIAYMGSAPVIVIVCVWIMIVTGALLAVGLLTGYLPVGYLQFDPDGLTIGQRRASFTLPWDSISSVGAGEFNDNPVLLLMLGNMDSVVVRPLEARARTIRSFATNLKWVGAHVMIMSSQYGIDLPFLVAAIERYAADPRSREGLKLPRLPHTY